MRMGIQYQSLLVMLGQLYRVVHLIILGDVTCKGIQLLVHKISTQLIIDSTTIKAHVPALVVKIMHGRHTLQIGVAKIGVESGIGNQSKANVLAIWH